ncbi:MAG: hypothetical protein RLN79_13755 [Cytophagales bacterium]
MDLQQLINIIGKKGKRNAVILSSQNAKSDDLRVHDLYTGLKTAQYKDERHAAQKIFNTDTADKNYIKLRSKLKDALFHNLFFLNYDNEKHPQFSQVEYEVRKNLLQIKILLREGDKENAEWLLMRTIKLAEKFHFTSELLESYTLWRNQISYSGNLSKFETVNNMVMRYEKISVAEKRAEYLLYASMCNILKSLVNKRRFVTKFKTWVKEIEDLRKKYNTPNLLLTEFRLKSNYYALSSDFESLLKLCNETEKSYSKDSNSVLQTKRSEIALNKIIACLNLKEFEEGKKHVKKSLKYFNKDNNNWFTFMENYFILCMRTGNFNKAGEVLDEVKTNVFFRIQSELARERWYIYQGYFAFVRPDHKPKFQIQSFLGKVPEFNKNMFGYNAATLIIHFFHLLKENDFEELHIRMDEMKKYIGKQISRSGNERLQSFLRLLQVAHQTGFNYKVTVEKSQNYLKKLKRFKGRAEAFEELEIMQYEDLWQILLQLLKERSRNYLRIN